MGHKHSVYDTDAHFTIDPITKKIKNESSKKNTLVQGDHNSERFSFDIPRFVEGHDMMLCDAIEIHYDNKEDGTGKVSSDFYEVDDKQISPADENVVIFSWLIIDTATEYAEIEAFRALATKYPYTTILNDCGAFMAVKYGIDTKTYIDKKFEELKNTLLGEN